MPDLKFEMPEIAKGTVIPHGVQEYINLQNEQWRKDNGQYIPNPATWLNQGRWDDVLTEAGAQPTKEEYHVGTWL